MGSYWNKKYVYILSGSLLLTLGLLIFFSLPLLGRAQDASSVVAILNLGDNQTLSQNYTFKFESTDNLDFVELHFIRLDNSDLPDKMAIAQRTSETGNFWSYALDLSLLGNGSYRLETIAIFTDGTEVVGQIKNFNIIRSTTFPSAIKILNPSHQAVVAGDIVFQAAADQSVSEIIFSIFNEAGLLEKQIPSSVKVAQTVHTVHLDSTTLSGDGLYTLTVQTESAETIVNSESITFYVANNSEQNSSSTVVNFTFTSPVRDTEISGKYLMQVSSNIVVEKMYFRFGSNLITARKYDNNLWQEYIVTTNYPNNSYELLAMATYQGREYYSPVIKVKVNNATTTDINKTASDAINDQIVEPTTTLPTVVIGTRPVENDMELQQNGGTTTNVTSSINIVECVNQDVKNITCQVYLRNKENFSDSCVTKVLDVNMCLDSYQKCKDSGIINVDNCFTYLNEPRASRWCDLENFKNEKLCIEYNAQRISPTLSNDLDIRCVQQGILNNEICNKFIEFINLPSECQNQKIKNKEVCDKFLKTNFVSTACQIIGENEGINCEQRLQKKYIDQAICIGEDCQSKLADFLPELAAREVSKQAIVQAHLKLTNGYINQASQDDNDIKPLLARLPVLLKIAENYKTIVAQDQVGVKDGQFIKPLPLVIIKDSDQDGLPDDMEYRLNTDPTNKDTDGDGYMDGDEVTGGYDPLLAHAKLNKNLAPVEIALLNGSVFEHASLTGSETSDLQISEVVNISPENTNGLMLSGIGPAYSVITLYIYSDIPLIATAQVDEYGRWQYALTDGVVDGEHQVYVAINDNTGRVEKKSVAKIFFVNEARAATVNEYIDLTLVSEPGLLEKYYLQGVIALVLMAIVIFLLIRHGQKSEPDTIVS